MTAPSQANTLDRSQLSALMPYGPSFLFIDNASMDETTVHGTYHIRDNVPFLADHFKHEPVFPASIMIEAMGQLGVLFLLAGSHPNLPQRPQADKIFFASADGIRCSRICRPGDTLTLELSVRKIRPPLAIFRGRISCNGDKVASAESITLIFDPTGTGAPLPETGA